jgi:hypothetical protein
MLVYQGPTDAGLNRHRRGTTTFGALNMEIDHSPTFTSGILHFLMAVPSGLILSHLPSIQISQIKPYKQ